LKLDTLIKLVSICCKEA